MKKNVAVLLLALTLMVFSGCSRTEDKPSDSTEETPSPAPSQEPVVVYNLLEDKWAGECTDMGAFSWNLSDCLEVSFADRSMMDLATYHTAVEGSCYYMLQDMYAEQNGRTLYWSVTDAVSGESVMKQWELQAGPDAGEEAAALVEAFKNPHVWLNGIDVSGDKLYLFIQQNEDDKEPIHYYKVQTDKEGHIEELLDLLPVMKENDLMCKTEVRQPEGYCDSAGLCYVGDTVMGRVGVIDREGKLLAVLEAESEALSYIGKMPEGNLLYSYGNFKDKRLVILTYDGEGQKELYRGEYELLQQCLIRSNGDLIYAKGNKLMRWNVMKGTREVLCSVDNADYSQYDCDGILDGADGKVFGAFRQMDSTYLYGFTDQEMETAVLRMEMLVWNDQYISTCASEYGKTHPGVIIEVAEPEEDIQRQLTRIMADLSQGEGPDLMLVRRSQLQALQGAGALAELSQVLPADEQEQIFPGVLDNGRIGDGLYGITFNANLSTFLVSDQVWQKETWSLEDVLQLVKEREQAGNPVELFAGQSGSSAGSMLNDLVLYNIGGCGLLDMQAGKCYFDKEEFRQVLELCKKWNQEAQPGRQTAEEMALEGKALACRVNGNLIQFSRAYAAVGEDFHAVGFPTGEKTGHLMWGDSGCVAVNTAADHREIIDDFLCFVVSYKAQKQYNTAWVRADVLKNSVREQREVYGYPNPVPVFILAENGQVTMTPLEGKPDGTSYLPEFLETVYDTLPYEAELDVVRSIVTEEADAYFAGDKGLEDTIRIIQSRVQLYLDEGNVK